MLQLNQGNHYVVTFDVKNADGSDKNLTGTTALKYQLSRKSFSDALVSFELSDTELNITEPTNGVVEVILSQSVTKNLEPGSYYHEILHYDALGIPTTLMSDNLRVNGRLIKE